jgi:hypothetical protein
MPDVKMVEKALFPLRETADAPVLAERGELRAPAREDLMRISLVSHIPHDAVVRRIKGIVESDRQVDHAEARGKMSAGPGHDIDDFLPELGRELREFLLGKFPQVFDGMYFVE